MKTSIIVAVVFCMAAGVCQAEQTAASSETIFQAGPGVLIVDKPHKGGDTKILPIPSLYYQQGRLMLFGTQARWIFDYEDGLMIAGLAKLRYEGYRSSESRYLRGMSNRRPTLEAGLLLSQDFDWATLAAEWTSDVLDRHRGHEIRLTASRRFSDVLVEKLSITPSVGCTWRSKQLNDYYYGVERREAAPGRPAYNVSDTVGLLTSIRADYPFSSRWSLNVAVGVEWLGSSITDSPIVDQHYRMSIFAGAAYRF